MTVATKRRAAKNEPGRAYYESKILFLEQENAMLRTALSDAKKNLVETENKLKMIDDDLSSMTDLCASYRNKYFTAKALINIPGNIAKLVEELVKTRLLLWDKTVVDIYTDAESFEALDELNAVFPAERK